VGGGWGEDGRRRRRRLQGIDGCWSSLCCSFSSIPCFFVLDLVPLDVYLPFVTWELCFVWDSTECDVDK
jgi:hypothetical protein